MTQEITKADFEDWQRNKVTKVIIDAIQDMSNEDETSLDRFKVQVKTTLDEQIAQAKAIGRMEAYSALLDISFEDDIEEVKEDYHND
jgi:hypothetical protein